MPAEHVKIADDGSIGFVLSEFTYRADQAADAHEIAALFTENGILSMGDETWTGRSAIAAGLLALRDIAPVGPGMRSRHILTNIQIALEDDQMATARSCFLLVSASTSPNTIIATGEFRDHLKRVGPTWLISRREVFPE